MTSTDTLLRYTLRLGDTALVCGQRLIELVTHGPELEEELAIANIALDYIGQARMYYSYAGDLEGQGRDEDDFAFRRHSAEFQNVLLVEQANGHFGDTIVRQVLFETFYLLQLEALERCADVRLTEIAARANKEIRYHLRHMSQWLVRLGDGTEESHRRVQDSLDRLWRFSGEMFNGDAVDDAMRETFSGPDLAILRETWRKSLQSLFAEATLEMPADGGMAGGGRSGLHGEDFSYLVSEMQHLQRSYPGANW